MTGDEVKKETMCGAKYSDIEVASMVRMLMRNQLNHEAVCTMGRDRIMYLSQRIEKLQAAWDDLIGNTEEADAFGNVTVSACDYDAFHRLLKQGV
ncbi:hypothetical protein AB4876_09260 [Zhongshania guokunii]|uniref:Uncharacterized protein n=1 Tax=Zhongshania guokunii TaxID=641783 RepID=A0ABV3U7X6_9GAMM